MDYFAFIVDHHLNELLMLTFRFRLAMSYA